ncbi:MAG: NAD-dependent epimerase/dehydratase family protein [Kofleriaceae bacterium]
MRVVIAGASGFIGRAIVRALAGHEVCALRRGASAEPCDALIWAAGGRLSDPDANQVVHVDAAVAAVRACQPRRVIYLSSGECYGAAPVPFREDGEPLGTSPYARAKLAGERAVIDAATAAGGVALVLRLGVVYGPGQAPHMLVPQVVRALQLGERVPLTHGNQTRDFVFVEDVARAAVDALSIREPSPGVINVGTGRETTVRELCLQLARAIGAREELLGFGELATRADEPGRYVLDVERAATVLGWQPQTPLAVGLERTIRDAA